MPTYDYECTSCGHSFEASQSITAIRLTKCPKCNKKVKRLIGSGGGFIFKGSGFYATDYKKSKAVAPAKSPASESGNVCPKAKQGCTGCQVNA